MAIATGPAGGLFMLFVCSLILMCQCTGAPRAAAKAMSKPKPCGQSKVAKIAKVVFPKSAKIPVPSSLLSSLARTLQSANKIMHLTVESGREIPPSIQRRTMTLAVEWEGFFAL